MLIIATIFLSLICFILSLFAAHFKNISEKDEFTGCYSKGWFMTRKNSKLVRMMRICHKDKRKSFGLVLFDMDKFKRYNDTKGHIAGDKLILDTVNTIKTLLRKGDFIARTGGDEFIVILKGLESKNDLDRKMYRVKTTVHKMTGNTISTGGILYNSEVSINTELVIKMADDDMYKDKESRRNS